MDANAAIEQVKSELGPLAADQDAMVEDVVLDTSVSPQTLTITVVREDATESLTADQVANLARLFSKYLDENDPIDGAYTLEVTTPGAEGAIITEVQWRRAVGKTVRVKRSNGNTVEGTLENVSVDGITLHLNNGDEHIAFADIKSARGVAGLPKEG